VAAVDPILTMDLQVVPVGVRDVEMLYRFIENSGQGVTQQDIQSHFPDTTVVMSALQQLLNSGRIFSSKMGGKLVFHLSDPQMAAKFAGLDPQHMLVYQLVEKAGDKGAWTKVLKDQTNLQQHTITRITKGLIQRQLIKEVKSMQNRKVFMLWDIEPAREVSGGTFYNDGMFNGGWLEQLRERCLEFLEQSGQRVVSLADLYAYVIQQPGPSVPTEEDISAIMRTLELDELIYSVQTASGDMQYCYRFAGGGQSQPFDLFAARVPSYMTKSESKPPNFAVPCLCCPLQMECRVGGRISPDKCEYISAWLRVAKVGDRVEPLPRGSGALMGVNDW